MLSDGPGVYAHNMVCIWLVEAPGPIRGVFTHFHTEKDSDFLTVYDGTGDNAPPLRTGDSDASFDGSKLPASFTTNSTSLKIEFTSDYALEFSGFELELSSLAPGGTWVPTGAPTAATTQAPESGATAFPALLGMSTALCAHDFCATCSYSRRRGVPVRPSRGGLPA